MTREELNRLRDETLERLRIGNRDETTALQMWNAAVEALWPVVEENQKLRAQVAMAKSDIDDAIAEADCGEVSDFNLRQCLDRLDVEPVAVVEVECCNVAENAWEAANNGACEREPHNPGTLIVWPNPVQEGGE